MPFYTDPYYHLAKESPLKGFLIVRRRRTRLEKGPRKDGRIRLGVEVAELADFSPNSTFLGHFQSEERRERRYVFWASFDPSKGAMQWAVKYFS